eukprot:Skav207146  [mRNA]  locus=scaffold573:37769:46996:+ [translate_table: standard]
MVYFSQELRGYYSQELYSCVALGDFIRFLFWLGLGVFVQWEIILHLRVFAKWWIIGSDDASSVTNADDDLLWWVVSIEMCVAFVAMSIKNWWLLSMSMGTFSFLLIKNWTLGRRWKFCDHPYVPFAYIMGQLLASFVGPCIAWWLTWTSQALDRVIAGGRSGENWWTFFFGFGRRHQENHGKLGFCGRRGHSVLHSKKWDLPYSFYRDDGCCHFDTIEDSDSDTSDDSDDSDDCWFSGASDSEEAITNSVEAILIDRRGTRQTGIQLHERNDKWKLASPSLPARKILQSHQHVLLYVHRPRSRPLVLYKEGSFFQAHLDRCWRFRCDGRFAKNAILFVLLYTIAEKTGLAWHLAIFFLLVPELLNDFLPNGSNTQEALDSHMLDGSLDQNLSATFTHGWACVTGYKTNITDLTGLNLTGQASMMQKAITNLTAQQNQDSESASDYMIEYSAVWACTFIMTLCVFMLIYGSYYLHNASTQLNMLNELLRPRKEPNYYSLRVWKLHRIRASVENKRFLELLARQSFPPLDPMAAPMAAREPFQWWINTRGAVYEDVNFTLQKRKPILGLFIVAELTLIVITLMSFVRHENDFGLACYAAIYGSTLGILTLLFIFLCSQVNKELQSAEGIIKDAVKRNRPVLGSDEEHDQFYDHEERHPLQLTFMGLPLDFGTFKACAAPVGTYLLSVAFWFLQHLVKPLFVPLSDSSPAAKELEWQRGVMNPAQAEFAVTVCAAEPSELILHHYYLNPSSEVTLVWIWIPSRRVALQPQTVLCLIEGRDPMRIGQASLLVVLLLFNYVLDWHRQGMPRKDSAAANGVKDAPVRRLFQDPSSQADVEVGMSTEPCHHQRNVTELKKQLELLREHVLQGDAAGVESLLDNWGARGFYVHNLDDRSPNQSYAQIQCSDLDFLARHEVRVQGSIYDKVSKTNLVHFSYMTILELALHMIRSANERALTMAMDKHELNVGNEGERWEERVRIIRLLLEKGFLWHSGDLVCKVVSQQSGYRKILREAFARTILHDLVRDAVHLNTSQINFLRQIPACGGGGMDGVVWILGSASGAFTLLGELRHQTVLMEAAQDATDHDKAFISFPELIRLHKVLHEPLTTVDNYGWNAEMFAARSLMAEHVKLLKEAIMEQWHNQGREAFSILFLGESTSDQLSRACIFLVDKVTLLAYVGAALFVFIWLYHVSLDLLHFIGHKAKLHRLLAWLEVFGQHRGSFRCLEINLRILWLLTLNMAFLSVPPQLVIVWERHVSPFEIPYVSKWNPLPATVHIICIFAMILFLNFAVRDYLHSRHSKDLLHEHPEANLEVHEDEGAHPEDRYQDPNCHIISCMCVFGLMSMLVIIYVNIVLRPFEMDLKKMGLWLGSLLVQTKITLTDTLSSQDRNDLREAFGSARATNAEGYKPCYDAIIEENNTLIGKRHKAVINAIVHWHRWACCMVTPYNPKIWNLLMLAKKKNARIKRQGDGAEYPPFTWSEINVRFLMSYISNGFYMAILVYTLPLWLSRGGLADFVLNSFATVYILELDDLTDRDTATWKLLDPESFTSSTEDSESESTWPKWPAGKELEWQGGVMDPAEVARNEVANKLTVQSTPAAEPSEFGGEFAGWSGFYARLEVDVGHSLVISA